MSDCSSSQCERKDCCPIGYVAIYDECGKFAGCVTPQEAEDYNNSKKECAEGYVKVVHPVTGDFIGCVVPADAQSLIASLTPEMYLQVSTSNVRCNGESNGTANTRIIGGTAPYVISYSGGADPAALAAGSYTVTVTDNTGLSAAYNFTIVEPDALVVDANVVDDDGTGSGKASAVVTGGVAPYSYVWKDNAGIPIGQNTQTATGLVAGTYRIEVTDFNGCVEEKVDVVIALIA